MVENGALMLWKKSLVYPGCVEKKWKKNLEKLLLLVCKFKELQCQLLSLQIFGHHRAPAFQQGLAKQARSGEENPQWNGG